MYKPPTCREMAFDDRPNFIEAVVTCEGNLHDPDFSTKFQIIVDKLKSLLSPSETENILHVRKIEPWNSVRVTISIPKEAAQRLKQLAEQGSSVLRQLGILSVQVEGDQVISLTLAGSNNEPTHVTLQHGSNSEQSFPSSSTSAAANFLISGVSNPSLQRKPQTPSSSVPFAMAGPSGVRFSSDVRNSVPGSTSAFRSPNVMAPPGDSSTPNFSQGVPSSPGLPPRIPLAGPFHYSSMVHAAAHNVQRNDTSSVQVGSDNSANVSNIMSNSGKANVGNAYVVGNSTNVQNTATRFHNVQQSTPVTGVVLSSQSGRTESGSVGTKFAFSNNSQSSATNAVSQTSSVALPPSSLSAQPGVNPSLQIQVVNVANSTLPPPPYPYNQQTQPPANAQIRQQQPHLATQSAAGNDKPMSSPLLVNLLQHGDTNGNNLAPSSASPRPQLASARAPDQMAPAAIGTSPNDNQQQYYRRQMQGQDHMPKRSLSLEANDSPQRLQEPNVFHDLAFTAPQSTSAITYSASSSLSSMSNSNNEQFQFAMPLPCDVPNSSRNSAEQQLRTTAPTITQNTSPTSQNSMNYRAMNPTEIVAFHQQQQQQHNQLQPTIRMQQQQQQNQTILQQSSYQKMQQLGHGLTEPNINLNENVQMRPQMMQQQIRTQQSQQYLLNGPASSQQQQQQQQQQYSSPLTPTIAQSNSSAPSFLVHSTDNSGAPTSSVAITSSHTPQQISLSNSGAGFTSSPGPSNSFYGTTTPTSHANIATAVHVTKIPVQQAISTLADQQQQIHSFVPLTPVNVTSVPNSMSNVGAANAPSGQAIQGQNSPLLTATSTDGRFTAPLHVRSDGNSEKRVTESVAKPSQSSKGNHKSALVPSIPTSVVSIRSRGPAPLRAPHSHSPAGGGKPRLLLNPLTGHLETSRRSESSSDSDEERGRSKTFTAKMGLGKGKPAEALASGIARKPQPSTISEQAKELQKQIMLLQHQEQLLLQQQHRLHQSPTPSTTSAGTINAAPSTSGVRRMSSEESKHDPLANSGEKIKLRLKLEKSEPVLSPAYKVDVSFIKPEEKVSSHSSASSSGPQGNTSTAASGSGSNPSLTHPNQGSSPNDQPPRVPPLHISLRGKNAAVVVSPRRDEREHSTNSESAPHSSHSSGLGSSVKSTNEPNIPLTSTLDSVSVNCVDAVVAAVSGSAGVSVKNRTKGRVKSTGADTFSPPFSPNKAKARPKNFLPDGKFSKSNVDIKSAPGKIRAKKSASFSSTIMDFIESKSASNFQPKKEKRSRRKSELNEPKTTLDDDAREPKQEPKLGVHNPFAAEQLEDSSPKLEDSQLLQLLSDNGPVAKLNVDKTVSTKSLVKILQNSQEDIKTEMPSILEKTTPESSKTEPSTSNLDDFNPSIVNCNFSVNSDTDISTKPYTSLKIPNENNEIGASFSRDCIREISETVSTSADKSPAKDVQTENSGLNPASESVMVCADNDKSILKENSAIAQMEKEEISEPTEEVAEKGPVVVSLVKEETEVSLSQQISDAHGEISDKRNQLGPIQSENPSPSKIEDKASAKALQPLLSSKIEVSEDLSQLPETILEEDSTETVHVIAEEEAHVATEAIVPKIVGAISPKHMENVSDVDLDHPSEKTIDYNPSTSEVKCRDLQAGVLHNNVSVQQQSTSYSSHMFNRNIAMKPIVEPSGGSGNGNTAGGEDSGIDSMDALSEKSPNQGESPVRKELEHHHTNSKNPYLPSAAVAQSNESEKCYNRSVLEPEPQIEPNASRTSSEQEHRELAAPTEREMASADVGRTHRGPSTDVDEENEKKAQSTDQISQAYDTHTNEALPQPEETTVADPLRKQIPLIDSSSEEEAKSDKSKLTATTSGSNTDPEQPSSDAVECVESSGLKKDVATTLTEIENAENIICETADVDETKIISEVVDNAASDSSVLISTPSISPEAPACSSNATTTAKKMEASKMNESESVTKIGNIPDTQLCQESVSEGGSSKDQDEVLCPGSDTKPPLVFAENDDTPMPADVDVNENANTPARDNVHDSVPNINEGQCEQKLEGAASVPPRQDPATLPPQEIAEVIPNLKESCKEEESAAATKPSEVLAIPESGTAAKVPQRASVKKSADIAEEQKEEAKAIKPTVLPPISVKPEPKPLLPSSASSVVTEIQPNAIPVSFLPRMEHSALRQRPLLRPHVQSPTVLLRPKLIDSTARYTAGVRSELKTLPKLQPKPNEQINHEPVQIFPAQSESSDSESQPNKDFQSFPISFSRSSGINLPPNIIQLTRAPSGAITSMPSKVPCSIISSSTSTGVVSVALPQVSQAGKTNPPRATVFAIHPNSANMLPQQIQQQQQTVTLASGHKVVPIKLVAFPRHTQGMGSFVGTPLNRSSPTLIEAVKTSAFRNVSASSPVHSSPQSISAVQMGVPGSGNITLVPISAVPTNAGHVPGQHNPLKLLVSSPLKVQQNLRQSVVVKSVVMGTPNIPRGATAIKVVASTPSGLVNHNTVINTTAQGSGSQIVKQMNAKQDDTPTPKPQAKAPTPTSEIETTSKVKESPKKPVGGGASIYKGIHGVELLDTTKNQDFLFHADIIHDEKDLADVLAAESSEITENGIEGTGSSSAFDFTHNDYDVLPPQPIKSAIRQVGESKHGVGKNENSIPSSNNEDELDSELAAITPSSPVHVLRSNSPLYTYSSNRVSSARNSDQSGESSGSTSPNLEVDGEDQEIIDSFSSSESLSKASPKSPDVCGPDKFPDHSYNQSESLPEGNGELGPLTINIPGQDYAHRDVVDKRSTRSTTRVPSPDITAFRSETPKAAKKPDTIFKNSPKASPTGSVKMLSPTIGGGSGASSARASPISNSASSTASSSTRGFAKGPTKRKRQESESSSASKDEINEDKMELIDLNSRPGKRRCSENAAELIKACIGIEDTPKRLNSFSRKLEDTKARERNRRNTPTILEQNESETDSIDFSLTGRGGSRCSSEDRSSSRGSSVQRSSVKSLAREEDGLDKVTKKKDGPRNNLRGQAGHESPNAAEKDGTSKARRSKRGAPAKSQNILGNTKAKNARELNQDMPETIPTTTGPRNERRKTRSSAVINSDKSGTTAKRRRISKEVKT